MADLIRTIDEEDVQDEADDGAGPVLSKGAAFGDLVSDDEAEKGPGWNFDYHATAASKGLKDATSSLTEKIQLRLQQKREEAGEEGVEQEATTEQGSKPKKAKAKKDVKSSQGSMEHLTTDVHFADLRLSRPLLRAITDLGFSSPTPIQRDVIPPALQGLDVLATAETGSGKTASFLLPALERLCQSGNVRTRKRDVHGRVVTGSVATKAMVLIPTRELAVQCHAMLRDLSKYTLVTHQLVSGGFSLHDQASSLRNQPDLVVATPGRLLDHLLNSQSVHMELLEIVVFDEADRLLEMGFRQECLEVLKRCSKGRQTMLFSATLNASVEDLAALALEKPVRVHANPVNRVVENLEQEFVKAPSEDLREAVLLSLCTRNYTARVIIFCATKQAAHRLAIVFGFCGLNFAEIHGNLAQADRVQALQRFQQEEVDFLLATDLASRGLDLSNVDIVINFHLPVDVARYIHRVGRTARMGRTGRAVTIYCPEEYLKVKKLGKLCCTKVKSKVLKRSVATDAIKTWADKVDGLKEDIEAILEEEKVERELRLSDMLVEKSENLEKHKAQIRGRPEKEWYMTNNEKFKLKSAEAAKLQNGLDAAPEVGAPTAKRRKDAEEKQPPAKKNKTRERYLQKKEQEKEERASAEARIRAAARRSRKATRPQKGDDGPMVGPKPKKKKKNKR